MRLRRAVFPLTLLPLRPVNVIGSWKSQIRWAVENRNSPRGGISMHKNIYVVIFVVVLIAIIVSVDLLFFRHHFWERLMSNIGIVLVFAAFGLRFLKK
jgi:uncharacterized membrane protein